MGSVAEPFNTAVQEPLHVGTVAPEDAPPRIRPGQRHFQCEVCRFMHDTGERAPQCHCTWIECQNPVCPASRVEPGIGKVRLKSRFCSPRKCRFFEAVTHA